MKFDGQGGWQQKHQVYIQKYLCGARYDRNYSQHYMVAPIGIVYMNRRPRYDM